MFDLNAPPATFSFRAMQTFVRENRLPCTDRRDREFLESAVAGWQETQKELIAAAADLKLAVEQSAAESVIVADRVELVATDIAVKVVEVVTSPDAVTLYKGTLRALTLSTTFVVFMVLGLARWCWERRDRTALYHWIQDAVKSEVGLNLMTDVLVVQWVVVWFAAQWLDEVVSTRDRAVAQLREWVAMQLVRTGCI